MYKNLLKLIQSILFMLLLIISTPILFLFALVSDSGEKSTKEGSDSESDDLS